MSKEHLNAAIASITTVMLSLAMLLSNISVVSAQAIPRNQIVWGAGYWPPQSSFNPLLMDGGQGWDTYIMYEPMFGANVATGQLISWLGQSITWVNSTTIQVTLRSDAYWVKMQANGTPVYYRPITSTDVQYSYLLYGAFTESPSWAYYAADLQTRVGSMSNFEIVNNQVFKVHINSTYANSDVVYRQLTRSYLIVPKDVWTLINQTYVGLGQDLRSYANDWTSANTQPDWKVASGMYLPHYYNDLRTQTIMQRNPIWWGASDPAFGRLPAPAYLGYVNYPSNPPTVLDLEAGNLDWDGSYIPGMDMIMAEHPNIHTYFAAAPYFADKCAVLMVPNHRVYPLGEPWLTKAITAVLDPAPISAASSGYLKTPSPLLIPADDAVARVLLNTTIEDQYRVRYNVTEALNILNQNCIKSGNDWYTKDGPSQQWLNLYPDHAPYSDALPNVPGVNVKLGPWTIMDISGWTDVNAIDTVAAGQVTSLLGIQLTTYFVDWGAYVTSMDQNNFNFVDYCMEWGINGNLYERYRQLFTGSYEGAWNHYGSYRNPTIDTLLSNLDTTPAGSQAQQNIANQLEQIVGSNLPIIPEAGHPDWYIYSDKYWVGWPDENHPLLPASPYGGSTQDANLHAILFGLQAHVTVTFSNIAISKANVVPGESTTVSVSAQNTQNIGGVSTVEFLVNGTIVDTQDVTFAASQTKTVSFNVTETQLGTYIASIGGLTATFRVVSAPIIPAYIIGNVTDVDTGNPISAATVIAGPYTTTTGTNGSYSLQVEPGAYNLTVVMDGYKVGAATVNALLEGGTYTSNVALTPLPSAEVVPIWVYGVIALFVIVAIGALAYAFVFRKKK